MKIVVRAKPKSKVEKVERSEQSTLGFDDAKKMVVYKVWVKEPPINGRANEAIVRLLAEYFGKPKSSVTLITGQTSKQKIFEIGE